ncbi:hypothetical protein SAMN02910317_02981 [Ruminococcaceae bacterium FB2012]|nr:hypothetical protein SAMN02910317_02981 [Ruminococcaceae bacterium FB2012]
MKGKLFRKVTASAAALLMAGTCLPPELSLTFTTNALESVTYTVYSWENNSLKKVDHTLTEYKEVTANLTTLGQGAYVVTSDTTIDNYIEVEKGETAFLIVPKGKTLTLKKGIGVGFDKDGKYATLNIHGEGKIVATGKSKAAGIGGNDDEANGNITIHGTTIEATGGKHAAGIGGGEGGKDPDANSPTINIFAGDITATGGVDGAGIGGGDCQPGARTYIYSGKITAESKKHGAGIGGGDDEGTFGIWIYGGEVTATGGYRGAGIGAGEEGGNLRKAEDGGGINILGGTVTATGGSGGAGIGGGYDEDMSGTINISGDYTKITANGGYGSAGIGAGKGDSSDWCVPEGDMKGTITIDCGEQSEIKVTGGGKSGTHGGGAGIGAGFAGNMTGKVHIKGGNIEITSGDMAAGIGGGRENGKYGGEGGDVYIGGGNITINTINSFWYYEDKSHAIGCGVEDAKDGSVYINADNNETGNYMRVAYKPYDKENFKTASASDRSKKTHTRCTLVIQKCDHRDYNQPETDESQKGLTTTITPTQHIKKCKYCGYTEQGNHEGNPCSCGYSKESNNRTVTVKTQHGTPAQLEATTVFVKSGDSYEIPECDEKPGGKRFVGWAWGDDTANLKQPGDIITVYSDVELTAQYADLYRILKNTSVPNGWIDASTFSADADDMITVNSVANTGYRLSSVTVKAGDENGEVLISKEIDEGDSFTIPMPAQDIYITAEFEEKVYRVNISTSGPGTVTADKQSFAYSQFQENETVTLTVTPASDYQLEKLSCKTKDGTEIELTEANGTYTFKMPAEDVFVSAEFEEKKEHSDTYILGVSLSLRGEIGVNIYVRAGTDLGTGGYMTVQGPNDSEAKKVMLDDSSYDDEQDAYRISCPVYSAQMGEKVTFILYNSAGVKQQLWNSERNASYYEDPFTYSVCDYAANVVKEGSQASAKLKDLASNMLLYGAWSREYLISKDKIPSETKEIISGGPTAITGVDQKTLVDYALETSDNFDVPELQMSLRLETTTSIRLYYSGAKIQDITAAFGSIPVDIIKGRSGGLNYIEIPDIAAQHLGDKYTVKFGQKGTIKVSALSFAKLVLDANNNGTSELCELSRALYKYNIAAKNYFDSKN